MQTIVIDGTKQEFNGERFYYCGNYFQHNGKRLHRAVWEYHHGTIPDGYHVHHKDGNKFNNSIENLELLAEHEHLSVHSSTEENKERMRGMAGKYRHLAEKWHHSDEAKEVSRNVLKKAWENAVPRIYTCECCGKKFVSRAMQGAKYCGNNCKAKALRMRRRLEKCQKSSLSNE